MILDVKLNLEEFYDSFDIDGLEEDLRKEVKRDLISKVKCDSRYKAFVDNKIDEALDKMESPFINKE